MVAARGDEPGGRVAIVGEDRHDDGDIGQMRAAAIRRVERVGVTPADSAPVGIAPARVQNRADALAHRAQMHRDVRRVGDEIAARIEQGAGEIEPLANVDRGGRALQRGAHLLGDAHEQASEDREAGGVARGADAGGLAGGDAVEQQIADRIDARAPAGFDDRGRHRIDDQRGAVDRMTGGQSFARQHRRVVPCTSQIDGDDGARRGGMIGQIDLRCFDRGACRHRFGDDAIDDQGLRARETELRDVRRVEGGGHRRGVGEIELDRMVGLAAAEVHATLDDDGLARDALRHQRLQRFIRQHV